MTTTESALTAELTTTAAPPAAPDPAVAQAMAQLRAEAELARQRLVDPSHHPKGENGGAGGALYHRIKAAAPENVPSLAADLAALYHKSGYRTAEQTDQDRRHEQRQQDYLLEERIAAARVAAGVEKRYQDADLDDVGYVTEKFPECLPAYLTARDRLASLLERPGLRVCHGKNGPGKTHQACALVNRFVSQGRSARYVRAGDFFLEVVSTFGAEGKTLLDLTRRYERYELLVIDEYEKRGEKPFHEQTLELLIDKRYAQVKSTVLITNLDLEDINDRLPRSVRSRIRGTGDVIHYGWGDLRRFGEER